ncbi:alpha/beta hydrolase [Humisphaera borealis]|uniref:Alpha/beta hydrolase n=1 Tax=Humisphaera borealis TaxID=2807512 RepID=A0A7M2X3H7_9BACT|nr:alpha/beta hydrolase [Humisphaera borealis]QOV91982.1 alpha/beta hydrolase [Humisphaera borealis]
MATTLWATLAHAEDAKSWDPGIPLFEGKPPGYIADAGPETNDGNGRFGNVTTPTLAVHLPPKELRNGLAIVVCPGGGYSRVGIGPKGDAAIKYFVPRGVAIFVLKYRTRPPSKQVEVDALADVQRAVRMVRHRAAEWGVDPDRIGMLGWSAGSHLILNLASHNDTGNAAAADPIERQSCRPNFVAAMCPWPSRSKPANFPATKQTPPILMCSARDDKTAPTSFAKALRDAYIAAGIECTLHEVETGGHEAFTIEGPGEGGKWTETFWPWLSKIKMVQSELEPMTK